MTDEFTFLDNLKKLPLHEGARGLQDDCAVIPLGNETIILTHDMMAEDTHFRPGARMSDVAWKLVALNLSDLASKGAEPIGILLGHSLSENDADFLEGLRDILNAYDVPILGGDTIAATGASTFGVTAVGRATHTPVPSRQGAKTGDAIYVTGQFGRAMLGFEGQEEFLQAFNRPMPRLEEGRKMAPLVSAMMDISDGLLLDAWRMAKASKATFRLNPELIPVADPNRLAECIRWGDDYELLFTTPPHVQPPIAATRIGSVEAFREAPLFLGGTALEASDSLGYQHG